MLSLRLRQLRAFGVYIPKNEVSFNEDGKHLLFSFDDEKSLRDSLMLSTGAQGAFVSYYLLFYKSAMSLVGFAVSSFFSLGLVLHAKTVPAEVNLMRDGKHVEIRTYTPVGGISKYTTQVPIVDIKGKKGKEGLKIIWNNQLFMLSQEGKIHNAELLYAVLRGLDVETKSLPYFK